jgi:hypothetical protein
MKAFAEKRTPVYTGEYVTARDARTRSSSASGSPAEARRSDGEPEPYRSWSRRCARRGRRRLGRAPRRIESISVPQGMWEYRNPGKLIADALGCPRAKSILAGLGVLQLQLLSDLCNAIAAGERDVGVVTAGEAKYRRLRSTITASPSRHVRRRTRRRPTSIRPRPTCGAPTSNRGAGSPRRSSSSRSSSRRSATSAGSTSSATATSSPRSTPLQRDRGGEPARVEARRRRRPTHPRRVGEESMLAFPYTKLHASHGT